MINQPPYNYREVILKPIEYGISKALDKDYLHSPHPEVLLEEFGRHLAIKLYKSIWAQNLGEKEVCKVPTNWFNHLKEHLFNKYKKYWIGRQVSKKFPVK